jgi:O-antigen/teichoic acid export membrane protein
LDELFTVSTKWVSLATLPFVLVFSLFASDAITAFFGASYTPAAPALAVLVGGLFIRALTGLNGDMVRAIDRSRIEFYAAAGGIGANVLLNVILIPQYGIVGAAIATVAGYGVYNGIEVLIIYLETGTSPFSFNVIKPLVPTTILAFGVSALVPRPLGLIQLIGTGFIFTLAQPISMFLTRSFDQSDLELVELAEQRSGRDLGHIKRSIKRQLTKAD